MESSARRYAQAQVYYQQLLEHHRMRPDDDNIWEMLKQARTERDIAFELVEMDSLG